MKHQMEIEMHTIQDMLDAIDRYQPGNDSFKLGYLRSFIECNILPYMSKKDKARLQGDLDHHIKLAKERS